MKNKIALRTVIGAFLLSWAAAPAFGADAKDTGSFFGRKRKSQTVQTAAAPVEAAPVEAAPQVPVEELKKQIQDNLATKGVSMSEIEEKGLPKPPVLPGGEDYDLSREIPAAPAAPSGPPEPNKGFIVQRSNLPAAIQAPPSAPKPPASAPKVPALPNKRQY